MLVEEMDRTSRVDGVYRKLVIAEKVAAIRREPPAAPATRSYPCIVANPPWRFDWRAADPSRSGACPTHR